MIWVQVFYHKFLIDIGAPFEEPSSYSFHEGRYCRITQQLVCKFNGVGLSAHGVCECCHLWQFGCYVVMQGPACDWVDFVAWATLSDPGEVCSFPYCCTLSGVMGKIHRSVLGSL